MDSQDRDAEGGGGAEESLTSKPSEIKASSEHQNPADLAEPEPKHESEPAQEPEAGLQPEPEPEPETHLTADGPKAEASEENDSEYVDVSEGREAAEDAGESVQAGSEAVFYEPESLLESQPETEPEPKELEEDEDEDEDEEDYEDEEFDRLEKQKGKVKRKESRFRPPLPLTTILEESAAPAPRAEKAKSEQMRGTDVRGVASRERRRSKEQLLHPREEDYEDDEEKDDFEDFEWSADVKKIQEQQLRGELVDQYRNLLVERNRYQRYNMYLQQRIQESLRKKGMEAGPEPAEKTVPEPESPEKEQAYLRYLAMLEELKKQEADDLQWYREEVRELKQQCHEKQARVEKEWRRFQGLKKQVVMQVMGSCRMRGGRQAALREVEQIQALEDKKEKEMSAVRLENVQLKQSLVHFETRMKAQEDLAEGLLLIDFEQLKIENQTFNEKVEERNEELLKLRSKVTSNVQIITHVKEKLSFIDVENTCKKAHLSEIENQVALGRDLLTKTKQARDNLRNDNIKLNQKCGLLGKESLLRDMEEKVEKTEQLNRRLESLKRHHAGLTLSCKGVKQKIRETKAFLPP